MDKISVLVDIAIDNFILRDLSVLHVSEADHVSGLGHLNLSEFCHYSFGNNYLWIVLRNNVNRIIPSHDAILPKPRRSV